MATAIMRPPRTAQLYHRYLVNLTKQEDTIEAARAEVEAVSADETAKHRSLGAYLAGLDIPEQVGSVRILTVVLVAHG